MMVIDSHIQIPFHAISMDDLWWYKAREKEDDVQACDSVFGGIFLWSEAYYTEVAKIAGCAVARYLMGGQQVYSYPLGGTDEERRQAVEILLKLSHEKNEKLYMSLFSEKQKEHMLQYFPGMFEIDGIRDRYDYVYETERLANLKGKKLAAKRNHINRFLEQHDWSYERINPDNKELCWEMEQSWFELHIQEPGIEKRELEAERKAIRTALDHYEELALSGGILMADGRVVAFCIGEELNPETMVVHFEKAYPDVQGAFQMINREFARDNCKAYKYINREEDTGDMGLRKAKLSYYPDMFAKKYYAVESNVTHATEQDEAQIINLWHSCFGDDETYIRFYLENRFDDENMLCIRDKGKIVSMASFLKTSLKWPGKDEETEALYVYAVATDPAYRGRGYASDIIKHASEKWRKPLILQHASETLQTFYEKLGFVKCFKRYLYDYEAVRLDGKDAADVAAVDNIDVDMEIISEVSLDIIKDYQKKRDAFFETRPYVRWDLDALSYALHENEKSGGYLVRAGEQYLMCRVENNAVRIVEALVHFDDLQDAFWQKILQMLCEKENCDILWIHNRGGMMLPIKSIDGQQIEDMKKNSYLGLTLD